MKFRKNFINILNLILKRAGDKGSSLEEKPKCSFCKKEVNLDKEIAYIRLSDLTLACGKCVRPKLSIVKRPKKKFKERR